MDIMTAYGIPERIVNATALLYRDTTAQVQSPDGDTDFFQITAGVLQGDTLAPFLFILALDYAMRTALDGNEELGFTLVPRRSSRNPALHVTDTDFADDIALLSDSLRDANLLLQKVEEAAQQIGLHINEQKTKFMSVGEQGKVYTKSGKEIEQVEDFQYLGAWISNTKKDIEVRIAKAWAAQKRMDNIWKSKMKRETKIHFFRAAVESILMYGAESWTVTSALEKRLNGSYTRLLRAALNVSWREHVTNKDLYGEIPKLSDTIKWRRLSFAGHCWRGKEIAKDLLFWEPSTGKRRRGRPAKTYIEQICEDSGLTVEELKTKMGDREGWRKFVVLSRATPD